MTRIIRTLSILLLLATTPALALAQTYPAGRPVTLVVPFTPGGPTDRVARDLAEAMRKPLGQVLLVENAAGAGGTIGTARVAKSAPDGYTVLLMHIGFATAPALYRKLQYAGASDFEAVGGVVEVPMTFVARRDFPANTFAEFVAYAKTNKEKMNFANAGVGSASHLCGLMFQSAIQTEFQTVPFKGAADAMTSLLGGQVDFICDQTTNTTQQILAHNIKAYGVTSKARLATLPALPPLAEQGLPGFEVSIWHGLWVPKGTPRPVIEKLTAALQIALKDPSFRRSMGELGAEIYSPDKGAPAAFTSFVSAETLKWGEVIKKAGIYAD
ncbi:tripartite tricarboxylate transporter substrate binding protein BugD [soil metagenome]